MSVAGMAPVVQTGCKRPESFDARLGATVLTEINASAKLRDVMDSVRGRLPWDVAIIAADTLVHHGKVVYGKPENPEQARNILNELRGTKHAVTTSVAMTYAPLRQSGMVLHRSVTSAIHMRHYSNSELDLYLASGLWRERAGGYGVQDAEFDPTIAVQGCYLNVVGLPLCAVVDMLPAGHYGFMRSHIYSMCAAHTARGQ